MKDNVPANNAIYYYHFNGLGSVVALSDSNGDTVQTYEYSVYGQVAAEDPEFLTNPYMFTGRRFDIETGLYYYRARYYNPHIGRFMQTDQVGYGAGINWYLYCNNNPLRCVDPSGNFAIIGPIPDFLIPDFSHGSTSPPWTISSGAPTTWQLLIHAFTNKGSDLNYTDSSACWDWATAEENWYDELHREMSAFLIPIWIHARLYHYDRETETFNLEGWDYDHPLTGNYTTPDTPDYRKVSFGEDTETYSKRNPYYWIHNTQVEINYTISFSEDGKSCTMTADFKIIDEADLELEYQLDRIINTLFPNYQPYGIEIALGTHTVGWSMVEGLTLDEEEWF